MSGIGHLTPVSLHVASGFSMGDAADIAVDLVCCEAECSGVPVLTLTSCKTTRGAGVAPIVQNLQISAPW